MKVDIEEDENEPELTNPYEEVDPLNPPPPASESEPEDVTEVENTIEHEDETVPASVHEVGKSSTAPFLREDSDGLLPGLMRRDINSLFGRMAYLSRRLCGRETAHALVKKKGKAKDEYYGKLILDLGNEVHSSVEQGTAAMEKLVERLGNTEEKAECKKLKKELEEARFSNTFLRMQNERVERDLYWTRVRAHEFYQEMIRRGFVFEEKPNEAIDVPIEDEKSPLSEPKANVKNDASRSGPVRGQDTAPAVCKCTFVGFMKCNPTVFLGVEGAVELRRWFKKIKSVFEISECAEGKKVKFAAATLERPALTCWKTKVATMGLKTVNQMPWTKMKQLMTVEFCPIEEVQRMEHELWNLKVKEYDVVAYTQRFNELALMCPRMVEPEENRKLEMKGFWKGRSKSGRSFKVGSGKGNQKDNSHQTLQNSQKQGNARAMVTAPTDGKLPFEQGHTRNRCPKKIKQEEDGEVHGRAYAIKDAEPQGPNVVTDLVPCLISIWLK
ncbi:putative reverse transcriptase domain-containing protein [Tanacetum coccineum]